MKSKPPKFLFLPSQLQRKRRNGMPQPHRLYLADGTPLPPASNISVECEFAVPLSMDAGLITDPVPGMKNARITLTFDKATFARITRKPVRR